MPKLIDHKETEYDFALVFRITPAPKVGDEIRAGTRDDNGQTIHFVGSAYVIETRTTYHAFCERQTTAYVRIFPPIIT